MKRFLSSRKALLPLPRLPVPNLQQTLSKYLNQVKLLVSPRQFTATSDTVRDFGKTDGTGEQLQNLLIQRMETKESWLSEWWMKVAYLAQRGAVQIGSSPGIGFLPQKFATAEDQLKYATKLVCGVLDYKTIVDAKAVPQDFLGQHPLCMDQYDKIFCCCRVPQKKVDTFVRYPTSGKGSPRHILVFCNNNLFSLDVYDQNNNAPLKECEIFECLKDVISNSKTEAEPIGLFTSQNRASWADIYRKLNASSMNHEIIDKINKSIFILCLDLKTFPSTSGILSSCGHQMLHGGGSAYCSGNRWFDKTIQFIVNSNGLTGLCYEHSTAEGPPVANLVQHMLKYCETYPFQWKSVVMGTKNRPEKLTFEPFEGMALDLQTAKEHIDKQIADVDLICEQFEGFGKDVLKVLKVSPDAFFQVALQVTYYRIYGHPCATYESGSTRKFHLGRTDTIRSCTDQTLQFSRAIDSDDISAREKAELCKKAMARHRQVTMETIDGQAFDRHLLGLRLTAEENHIPMPDLFSDPSYTKSLHFHMSTSQVPMRYPAILCFGAVVPDGYGICYNPQNDRFIVAVSSYYSCDKTSSHMFYLKLKKTLLDLRDLLASDQKAKL